jgi:hypothetical protein
LGAGDFAFFGQHDQLKESDLEQSSVRAAGTKGDASLRATGISWRDEWLFASLALGVRHAPVIDPGLRAGAADGTGVFLLRASLRLADQLWLTAPLALVVDFERDAPLNFFVWGGAPVLGATSDRVHGFTLNGFTGLGADARFRQSERHTFNASLAALGAMQWTSASFQGPSTWTTQVTLGLSETIPDAVTFNIGAGFGINPLVDGHFTSASFDSNERNAALALGSVQRAGLRPLPLIHVPLSPAWAIDAHAVVAYQPARHGWVETYTAAVSYEH